MSYCWFEEQELKEELLNDQMWEAYGSDKEEEEEDPEGCGLVPWCGNPRCTGCNPYA